MKWIASSRTRTASSTTTRRVCGPTTPILGATLFKSTIRASGVAAAIGLLILGAASAAALAEGPQSLVDLIRDGNREAVLAAITSPAVDVNAAEPDGSTALLWATYKVDHEIVRALLKAGAKASITNAYGSTPLTEA